MAGRLVSQSSRERGVHLAHAACGGGRFTTVGVSNGKPLFIAEHLDRLMREAQPTQLPRPSERQLRAMVVRVLRVNKLHAGVIRLGWHYFGRSLVPFALCEAPRPLPEGVVLQLVHVDGPPVGRYAKSAHQLRWESFRYQARSAGVFDVLVIRRGWVTETARFNVFLELHEGFCTPPATEVFGGVARAALLADSGLVTREKPLSLSHLARASRVVLANSVRGRIDAAQVVDQGGRTIWRHPARRAKTGAAPRHFAAA